MESGLLPPPGLRLHHVGIVVEAIEADRVFYVEQLGYKERTGIIHDPAQTAFVQFFRLPGADHYLELVAPDSPQSLLAKASRKGMPLNHLCYAARDIDQALASFRNGSAFVAQEPVPAVAFDLRRIAWVVSRNGLKIELVEAGPEGSL